MKRFVCFFVLITLFLSGYSASAAAPNDEQTANYQVGDVVEFGAYEQDNITSNGSEPISWIVLKVEGNETLLLSDKIIDCYAYNRQERNMTWENCTLRAWLNSTFLSNAFSPEEQSHIIAHSIVNEPIQQKYIKDDGSVRNTLSPLPGCTVNDKVFLLSFDELHQYFSTNENRIANPTPYVILNADDAFKWWTRSPGTMVDSPKFVTEEGATNSAGATCTLSMGIRPAIWVTLGTGHVVPNQKRDIGPDLKVSSETPAPAKTPAPTYAPSNDEQQLTIDDIILIFKDTLDSSVEGTSIKYSIKEEDNLVNISMWSDGITQIALAALYNKEYKNDWDQMADTFIVMQKVFQGIMDENGHGDTLVALGVLNDVNKDNLLLYIGLGMVLYDGVNNVDLLGLGD